VSRSVVTLGVLTAHPDEDVLLLVEVRGGAFTGTADVWVLGDAMAAFLAQARTLYERLDGRASLESISPGELALSIERLDAAGHLGVGGRLAQFATGEGGRGRFAFELAFTDRREFEELRAFTDSLSHQLAAAGSPH
jgi:hypothetical protein